MGLRRAITDVRTMNALLPAAEREAQAMGDAETGPEHLLLAALAMPDGQALEAFAVAGVDPAQVRQAIIGVHAEALESLGLGLPTQSLPAASSTSGAPPRGVYDASGPAREVFQRSVELAKSRGEALSSGHVLAAVREVRNGTIARVLEQLGVA
jgi:ATP-dependent Clp protease ATP-binding subunit ClpA